MKRGKIIEKLAKILSFILGREPSEFGLVPDADGYIKIKDLLKALSEEDGWRHIRHAHLNEVLRLPSPPIEITGVLIRARHREHLPEHRIAADLPGQLFTCVRTKAYPVVLEKGVSPTAHPVVILSAEKGMAERIGRRSDPSPVLLVVSVRKMRENGPPIFQAGGALYVTDRVPPQCFTGPPLPKSKEEPKSKDAPVHAPRPKTPGSFLMDLTAETASRKDTGKRGKKTDWKRERKRMNRRGRGKENWK